MLDITLVRKDLASVVARLETRKKPQAFLDVHAFTALEAERKTIQTRTEELQAQRNQLSKQIGQLKSTGESVDGVMAQVAALKAELDSSAARLFVAAKNVSPRARRCAPCAFAFGVLLSWWCAGSLSCSPSSTVIGTP